MNKLNIQGNWNELAGKLKQKFANLNDDDLLFKEGKEKNFWEGFSKNSVKQKNKYAV